MAPDTGGTRTLRCARCGATFFCRPAGNCWCATESLRLPVPADGQDCLCRACLQQVALDADDPHG
ncbi:cysteine-rich CWC family protein [Nakamurella lactea]|uniref:cysteine-rich CWC family protein n=1 Tax=Nakamurella lactea TaxID=459515 RepID=UPI00041B985B|nr:cysteine-rich CWC family protein [Nakamurella lactea]